MEVVNRDEMKVMGIAIRTTNENGQSGIDIGRAWERFYQEQIVDRIPNKKSDEVLGVYLEYEGDHTKPFTLVIGCEVEGDLPEVPEGLVLKTVPAAKYAPFQAKGKFPESLVETWQQVWNSDLKRAYTADLEIYGERFHADPSEVDLLISVNP